MMVFGLKRSQRATNPRGNVDLSLITWHGLTATNPAMSRPVLSTSMRGAAAVFAPVSPPSFRVSHSAPADSRGSRTPTNTPDRVLGSDEPTGPIWPGPPLTNELATAP